MKATNNTTKIRRISNVVCGIVIVVLIAASILLFVRRSQNKVTFIFGKAAVWIVSPSMEELIEEKSYILVEKIDPKDIAVGDIIMFYSSDPQIEGQLNTHRVEAIVGDHEEFVTKGDNNPVEDKYTAKAENVVGIYRKNLHGLTGMVRFFLTKGGLVVIIVLFVGLTAFLVAPDFIKAYRDKKQEDELKRQQEIDRLVQEEIRRLKDNQAQITDEEK